MVSMYGQQGSPGKRSQLESNACVRQLLNDRHHCRRVRDVVEERAAHRTKQRNQLNQRNAIESYELHL